MIMVTGYRWTVARGGISLKRMARIDTETICPLCERLLPRASRSRHHLKTRRLDKHLTAIICTDCHRTIHALFDNRELRAGLDNIEALRAHPDFAKALTFIRKQPVGSVRVAKKKR